MQQLLGRVSPLPAERAFVVQFRVEAAVEQGHYAGRVEHVVSGQSAHFGTLAELLAFMARVLTVPMSRLDLATGGQDAGGESTARCGQL